MESLKHGILTLNFRMELANKKPIETQFNLRMEKIKMTRRTIVYKGKKATVHEGYYFISREFNGDKYEAALWNPQTPIKANWNEIIELFNGVNSLHDFRESIRKAEDLYTYENISLRKKSILPQCEEIWMLIDGKLQMYSKYGEVISR